MRKHTRAGRVRRWSTIRFVKNASKLEVLREALTRRGRVMTLVELDSGPCWAMATKLEARRGAARVHIDLAGAPMVLPIDRVLEVSE